MSRIPSNSSSRSSISRQLTRFPPTFQEVLGTIFHINEAVLIHGSQAAGVKLAVSEYRGRLRRGPPVTVGDFLSLSNDLATSHAPLPCRRAPKTGCIPSRTAFTPSDKHPSTRKRLKVFIVNRAVATGYACHGRNNSGNILSGHAKMGRQIDQMPRRSLCAATRAHRIIAICW